MSKEKEKPRNREAWLTDFMALVMPLMKKRTGLVLGESTVKLSCGFPSRGGTRAKNRTIGECHHVGSGEGRKFHQIFIHPQLVDPVEIGGVVVHEILHAMLPAGVGHKKPFAKAAVQMGLEGKPTSTTVGEELAERIKEVVDMLGDYPHESLEGGYKKQTTRLRKVMCVDCGYVCRVTDKWLDEAGAPICPQCLVSMEEAGTGDAADTLLVAIDQMVEYHVKASAEQRKNDKLLGKKTVFDPRYTVRMHRKGKHIEWLVIDHGPSIDETGRAILGSVRPRLLPVGDKDTKATRRDAEALVESLREGLLKYEDLIDVDDNDPALDDDPERDWEDEDETADYEDSILTDEELAEYEAEERQREGRS